MSDSVMAWVFIAVLLFWSMGAYNRLVRLRSQGISGFATLESVLMQYSVMVKTNCPATDDDCCEAWLGLAAASDQFTVCLKVVQAKPLNGPAMQTLQTALETLTLCWSRLRDLPPDLAGSALPGTLQTQWDSVAMQAEVARIEFNKRVELYNEAIHQFPALLLAWVFGFKPAMPIEVR